MTELTQEPERAVAADKKLLLVATSVLSLWTLEQITATCRLSEAECVRYFVQLDRIGFAARACGGPPGPEGAPNRRAAPSRTQGKPNSGGRQPSG